MLTSTPYGNLAPVTIYEEQVPTPIDSPAHQGDFVVDILEQI